MSPVNEPGHARVVISPARTGDIACAVVTIEHHESITLSPDGRVTLCELYFANRIELERFKQSVMMLAWPR
jgi:hypothetical protein